MTERGVRIGNETIASVPREAKLRPLRDVLIVEPLEYEPSKTLEVVYRGKPLRGKVKAVGKGCYPKKYDGPKGKRTRSWDSKYFLPTQVKVGDIVELGGLEIGGFLFQTFRWGDKEHVICREADVCLIHE